MKRLFKQLNLADKTVLYSVIISVIILLAGFGVDIARAAWEEPQAQPPAGNIYAPLNSGPAKQAKQGRLLLDPSYDPNSTSVPQIDYQLEVRGLDPLIPDDGLHNTFVTYLDVVGGLTVDATTLTVLPGSNPGQGKVGIGTDTPGTDAPEVKIEIVGGTAQVGTGDTPIIGTAITSTTSAAEQYGIYAEKTNATDVVIGVSTSGAGISGSNTANGQGIYGISETRSGVSGSSDATYDAGIARAAVYGATAPTGWAGYFQQRLFGSDQIIGRKFSPNRLQLSQIPYTAGWEMRTVDDSYVTSPHHIAFDGQYIWISQTGWDNTQLYLINPITGVIAEEINPTINDEPIRDITKLLYINGEIWASGNSVPGPNYPVPGNICYATVESLIQISTDASHTVINHPVGPCHDGVRGYVVDMVYDNTTTPGHPYIWTVNQLIAGGYPNYTYGYSISRFDMSDNTYTQYTVSDTTACLTLDPSRCNDGIDNDSDGKTDRGCTYPDGVLRWGVDTLDACDNIPGYIWDSSVPAGDSQCYNGAGSPPNLVSDERLVLKQVGHPTGITYDSTNRFVWISFDGMNSFGAEQQSIAGEGLVKVDATNPTTSSVICMKNASDTDLPGRKPSDITIDSTNTKIWMSYDSTGTSFDGGEGIGRLDPTSNRVEFEYTGFTGEPPRQIQFDGISTNGPFLWMSSTNYGQDMYKYRISNSAVIRYMEPSGLNDFTFDRMTSGGPYVWGAHNASSLVSKNQIDSPYQVVTYIPKGAESGGVVFDGTYVWTTNSNGYSVGKYRATDGKKIGDYPTGRMPNKIIYDGASIWTVNWYDPTAKHITRIRATDGARLGDYDVDMSPGAPGLAYDGRYMWASNGDGQGLRKIDLVGCIDADGGGTGTGSCPYQYFGTSGAVGHVIPVSLYPNQIIYDGQNLWVTSNDNRIYKVAYANTSIIANDTISVIEYAIPEIDISEDNITAINFDGTYIWLGTRDVDSTGSSLYKFNPVDCAGGICPLAAQLPIYHEAGKCSGGTNPDRYCSKAADCLGGGTCTGMASRVTGMTFDGTNMWVYNGTAGNDVATRECYDEIDNDGDGSVDELYRPLSGLYGDCEDYTDLHEGGQCNDGMDNDGDGKIDYPDDPDCTDTNDKSELASGVEVSECSDGIDNDGNGQCDFDGAAGGPGCSGKRDPGCSSAADISEVTGQNDSHLTRIVAATNQIVESNLVANYSGTSGLQFDGTNIWMGVSGSSYVLHQYYSGSGNGLTDMLGLVNLQGSLPGTAQPQSFSINGSATLGANLTVVGDLVVQNNAWGSGGVNKNFGTSCDSGEFATEVTPTGIICKKL